MPLSSAILTNSTTTTTLTTPYQAVKRELPLLVHVTAPATLPAGYTFEAEINGDPTKLFTCEVPTGGVQEGQIILVELPKNYNGSTRIDAPTGKWKDGIFNCCSLGIFHPSLVCSWCCNSLAMGQIISRVQLTWLGEIGTIQYTNQSCTIIVILTICYIIYSLALFFASYSYSTTIVSVDNGTIVLTDEPSIIHYLRLGGTIIYTMWSIYTLYRIRQNVRTRYQIPEHYCRGCEDICCSIACSCCTVSQLLRHTGEYETYPGVCCSKTGHPPGTPLVV